MESNGSRARFLIQTKFLKNGQSSTFTTINSSEDHKEGFGFDWQSGSDASLNMEVVQYVQYDIPTSLDDSYFGIRDLTAGDKKKRLHISVHDEGTGCLVGSMSFGILHLMRKAKSNPEFVVKGWYYLLSKELGHRKHVLVPVAVISSSNEQEPHNCTGTLFAATPSKSAVHPMTPATVTLTISIGYIDGGYGFTIRGGPPILISCVKPNGAAEAAGLNTLDVLLSVNGNDVTQSSASFVASLIREIRDASTESGQLILKISRSISSDQNKNLNIICGEIMKDSLRNPPFANELQSKLDCGIKLANNESFTSASKENIPPKSAPVKRRSQSSLQYKPLEKYPHESYKSKMFECIKHSRITGLGNDTGYETLSQCKNRSSNLDTLPEDTNTSYEQIKLLPTGQAGAYTTPKCTQDLKKALKYSKWCPDISDINNKSLEAKSYFLITSPDDLNKALCETRESQREDADLTETISSARIRVNDSRSTESDEGLGSISPSNTDSNNNCSSGNEISLNKQSFEDDSYIINSLNYNNNNSYSDASISLNNSYYENISGAEFDPSQSNCESNSIEYDENNFALVTSVDTSSEQSLADDRIRFDVLTCEPHVAELFHLETEFITFMTRGVQQFSHPLRFANVLPADEHRILFQNIDKLVLLSEYRRSNLRSGAKSKEQRECSSTGPMQETDSDRFSKDFLIMRESYQAYIDGLTRAFNLLDDLLAGNNTRFREFIAATQSHATDFPVFSITEFLLRPVQHFEQLSRLSVII